MRSKTYEKRTLEDLERINKIYRKIVYRTNEFKEKNLDVTLETFGNEILERKIDSLGFMTAWIYDRLNNKSYHDRSTMRKKIRKALGYNPEL